MKKLFVFAPVLFSAQAFAWSIDHTGLLHEVHGLEVNANTVRVELHGLNQMRVFSTGERRNRQGELHKINLKLEGLNEYDNTRWMIPGEIYNLSKDSNGGDGYVDIDVGDRIELFERNGTDASGARLLKEVPWINARRGSRLTITIDTKELDCSGHYVCGRDNDGAIVYEMTVPPLPSNLPSSCGTTNSFPGRVIDGVFQFAGTLDHTRNASGGPIIEPSIFELDSFMCFLPVVE